jgi:hypothetical protein
MTAHHDPDRVIRAWLDLMPDEAPYRTVAAVLQAVEATPQARRPRLAGRVRYPTMSRFAILAAAAAVVVAIGGVALLGSRPATDPVPIGAPSASPAQPTPAATPPATSAPTATPAPTAAVAPLDTPFRSHWLADIPTIEGLGDHEPRVRLVVGSGGRDVALQTNSFGNTTLSSVPVEVTATELRLVTDVKGVGCEVGDEGRYRWRLSDDSLLLTLETIADACATRAAAFARTWTRSLDAHSAGGRGALAAFDPMVLVTLPDAPFSGSSSRDVIAVESITEGIGIFAMKNPWGLTEPCTDGGGATVPIEPGVDALVAQLGAVPGMTVTSEEMTIDGHRAARVAMTTDAGIACPAGEISAVTAKNVTSGWRWSIRPGDTASLYVVELPDATYLLEYFGEGVTPADEAAVMSSIRFVDALPPAP